MNKKTAALFLSIVMLPTTDNCQITRSDSEKPNVTFHRFSVRGNGLCEIFSPILDLNTELLVAIANGRTKSNVSSAAVAGTRLYANLMRWRNRTCSSTREQGPGNLEWQFLWITNESTVALGAEEVLYTSGDKDSILESSLPVGGSLFVYLGVDSVADGETRRIAGMSEQRLEPTQVMIQTISDRQRFAYSLPQSLGPAEWHWPPQYQPKFYEPPREKIFPEFPWPPPATTAQMEIPRELFDTEGGALSFKDVDLSLTRALSRCGYTACRYFSVPDGFAMVTQLEQIKPDGSPESESRRWGTDVSLKMTFSLDAFVDMIKTMFKAEQAYFRVIVFVVTPHPFSQTTVQVSRSDAEQWLITGWDRIPKQVERKPFTEDHKCKVLVYEFVKHTDKNDIELCRPARLNADTHMTKSGLLGSLQSH